MKYRIITITEEGKWKRVEFNSVNDLRGYMEDRGHQFHENTRFQDATRLRDELIGQPKFNGFHGPMWDGDAIRYEDLAAYARLSQ